MDLFDSFINSAAKLIGIDSVQSEPAPEAPFGKGVSDCLEAALDIAKSLGFRTANGGGYYGFAECGSGELFGILGHLDTVPFDSSWSVPPLSGLVKDGYLYGRGVQDDKAPVLMCLFAAAELIKEGLRPKKRIRVIFGCNEESGWKCMEEYVKREELPAMGFTPDADFPVINCEKGVAHYTVSIEKPRNVISLNGGERANMVMDYCRIELTELTPAILKTAQKSGYIIENNAITAQGKAAHGSTPEKGDNALHKILKLMSESAGGEWGKLYRVIKDTDGSGAGIAAADEISGALTVNFGTVRTIENKIVFDTDIRYPLSVTRDEIAEKLRSAFGPAAEIYVNFFHDPLYVDKSSQLVTGLLSAYERVTGEKAEPISIGGATYARAMPPGTCVAFGPIFPDEESTIHGRDERASVESMRAAYRVYKEALKALCF